AMTFPDLHQQPGYLFVWATLLPLASFLAIFLTRGLWGVLRPFHEAKSKAVEPLFRLLDGKPFQRAAAWVAVSAIAAACVCSVTGLVLYEVETHQFADASLKTDDKAEGRPAQG